MLSKLGRDDANCDSFASGSKVEEFWFAFNLHSACKRTKTFPMMWLEWYDEVFLVMDVIALKTLSCRPPTYQTILNDCMGSYVMKIGAI